MKIAYKIIFTLLCGILAQQSVLAENEQLPLSKQQITKLQQLFPEDYGVPEYQHISHEHVIWQQIPINVILPVGRERMVHFPVSVEFGYDKSVLSDEKLTIQNNNGTLYFLAKSEFPTQRVQTRCSDSGQIILLNLSARKGANMTPLDVVIADKTTNAASNRTDGSNNSPLDEKPAKTTISAVTLTRFAAQQLYAPKRLLVQPPTIYRVPMHTSKTVPLFLDGSVIAMPLASWRGGDLTVTAVLLRNQLKQILALDPRNLCGNWQTATFFPQSELAPAGNPADSTTVFLVANRSFADSLQVCTRGF